jgi:1,4-dihydroxy-2-naphthoyl-CoA hydrolase
MTPEVIVPPPAARHDRGMTPDQATDLVRSSMPLCDTLDIRALAAGPEEVRLEIDHAPGLCTAGGVLHGGVVMALADSAGGTCAYLNLPDGASGTTTLESKTNFLGAVRNGTATAVATPLHVGGSTIVVETLVTDGAARPVAKVTQTQMILRPR